MCIQGLKGIKVRSNVFLDFRRVRVTACLRYYFVDDPCEALRQMHYRVGHPNPNTYVNKYSAVHRWHRSSSKCCQVRALLA